jgi:RND superfamily putative drug exporter
MVMARLQGLVRGVSVFTRWFGGAVRRFVIRHPWVVVGVWVTVALVIGLRAPNLTELAAEGQAHLLPSDTESILARQQVQKAWPDQSFESVAVALLHRPEGLTAEDHAYAAKLAERLTGRGRPEALLRVLGPNSIPEIARYLVSDDQTSQLLVAQLSTSFVAPASQRAVDQLQKLANPKYFPQPAGLQVTWTGDALFGRDYMANVQRSLDRAAVATVFLLLIVLLVVYRSLILALVPLGTIGLSLVIARGVLAWMTQAGWAMSPLVELFLVVVLFGCGTDFVLFLSWRFGELWNPSDVGQAVRRALERATEPLLTSSGTVIAGLMLMGLTRFKLFSATGPSVALGLALTMLATLTLTPALLLLLARHRPKSFAGLTAPSSGFWDTVGRRVLKHPVQVCCVTLLLMAGPAAVGFTTWYVQDVVGEMPQDLDSVKGMRRISEQFGAGRIAPLSVVIRTPQDFRSSEGLALIDDLSRMLARQRRLLEVRSATRPLGTSAELEPARLGRRIEAVVDGFDQMISGASQLKDGLNQGAAKLRTAILIEDMTGLSLTGASPPPPAPGGAKPPSTRETLVSGLEQVTGALFLPKPKADPPAEAAKKQAAATSKDAPAKPPDPRELMLGELSRAAEGADQIGDGATRARQELTNILADPVGQHALDRLLINSETLRQYPELLQSFEAYISPDGHLARFDLVQADRLFSAPAMDQVQELRQQLRTWLADIKDFATPHPGAVFTGSNAESADIRTITWRDQQQSWIVVPVVVFFVLWLSLRDAVACAILVGTMILTYGFALGITHIVFVSILGAEGLDWKVPYFLFVLLVAVGVDYNVFLMSRLQEESRALGLRAGIIRAVAQTGGLISSAAAITACSFAAFLLSPLGSIRQLGLALVVGIVIDAMLVRPVLVPCGVWLLRRRRDRGRPARPRPELSATAFHAHSLDTVQVGR